MNAETRYESPIEQTEQQRDQVRLVNVKYKLIARCAFDRDRKRVLMRPNQSKSTYVPCGTCVSLYTAKTFCCDLKRLDGGR